MKTKRWKTLNAPEDVRCRYGHTAVVYNNFMFVYGGDSSLEITCEWKYDLVNKQWTPWNKVSTFNLALTSLSKGHYISTEKNSLEQSQYIETVNSLEQCQYILTNSDLPGTRSVNFNIDLPGTRSVHFNSELTGTRLLHKVNTLEQDRYI